MNNDWKIFTSESQQFDFSGDKLEQSWPTLHAGNLEPFPECTELQEAWRSYHQGDFATAAKLGKKLGNKLGTHGAVVTAFATVIYAQYMEENGDEKIRLFKEAMALCEEHIESSQQNHNLYYIYAVAMGRYSQFISMVEALQQGFGKKIRDATDQCLTLAPTHAEALVTLGGWNAEIVDKAGAMLGKMMYGATKENSIDSYQKAIELAPNSPVPYVEYGYALQLMYGESKLDDTVAFLDKALILEPADAMQALDLLAAQAYLQQLSN